MTHSEQTYAAWLNILGSDPLPLAGPVEHETRVMRVVATSCGDGERFSHAYMDVLLALATAHGFTPESAKEATEALVTTARAHMVRYVPGIPMMIEGLDCSPEAVRALKADRDYYRSQYIDAAVNA